METMETMDRYYFHNVSLQPHIYECNKNIPRLLQNKYRTFGLVRLRFVDLISHIAKRHDCLIPALTTHFRLSGIAATYTPGHCDTRVSISFFLIFIRKIRNENCVSLFQLFVALNICYFCHLLTYKCIYNNFFEIHSRRWL